MKIRFSALPFIVCGLFSLNASAQTNSDATKSGKKLYMDIHELGPGKVKFEDVAAAHEKDLAVEKKYGVHFMNFWVDEEQGLVYCLSSANDTSSITKTHAEAHGLLPAHSFEVTNGAAAPMQGNKQLFMDTHKLGEGNVTAAAVEDAHKKDLAVQQKHGVNFINYWVDTKRGVIFCLSEAKNAETVVNAHKEAHGLVPTEIRGVKQGE